MRLLIKIMLLAAALALPLVLTPPDSFAESGCHRNGPPSGGGSSSG